MMNLSKISTNLVNLIQENNKWIVVFAIEEEVYDREFSTIEFAADFMTDRLNVDDEHIDYALCQLAGYDHSRAIFKDGKFSHSEST